MTIDGVYFILKRGNFQSEMCIIQNYTDFKQLLYLVSLV